MGNRGSAPIYGEPFHEETLSCGLRAYSMPKPEHNCKSVILSVDFGSANLLLPPRAGAAAGEPARVLPFGVAHFLEHRLFERNGEDISDTFASLGAEVNAHTGYTSTDFVVSCVDRLDECIELLMSLVLDIELTEESISRERDIITKEIELYGDSLEWVSYFSIMRTIYPDEPLSVDMAGTRDSVSLIDQDTLLESHRIWYRPEKMSLFMSGRLESSRILERVSQRLALVEHTNPRPAPRRPNWRRRCHAAVRERATLDIARPRMSIGFRDPVLVPDGPALIRRELAADIALDMLFGPASAFYSASYEQGLIDLESFGYDVYVEPEFGYVIVAGDSDSPDQLEEAIVRTLERAKSGRLYEADFARAKRKAFGNLVDHFNDVEACTALIHSAVSRGGSPADFFSAHDSLTLAEVGNCIETWLDPEHYGLSLLEARKGRLTATQPPSVLSPLASR